ncbi:MAG: hypothetical protein AB1489_29575 [Acidobacteriota bacterium]
MLPEKETSNSDDAYSREYYQLTLKDGYRGLLGAGLATAVAELILFVTEVGGNVPLIFAVIGAIYAVRHLVQIWQAKQQLKQLSE